MRYFTGLTKTIAIFAFAITDDDKCSEANTLTTLDSLGDARDFDDLFVVELLFNSFSTAIATAVKTATTLAETAISVSSASGSRLLTGGNRFSLDFGSFCRSFRNVWNADRTIRITAYLWEITFCVP